MGWSEDSLAFSVLFSYFLRICWRSCFGAAYEVEFEHDLLSCLKDGRMNGLCTALRVLKYPILPNQH